MRELEEYSRGQWSGMIDNLHMVNKRYEEGTDEWPEAQKER